MKKSVCKKCYALRNLTWRTTNNGYLWGDEETWTRDGQIWCCCVDENQQILMSTERIPEKCPYKLEHIVMEQEEIIKGV
jgi:hypothetical protein